MNIGTAHDLNWLYTGDDLGITSRLLSKMGHRKIQMIAGRKSKIFHFVFLSNHKKKTGIIVITAITPTGS